MWSRILAALLLVATLAVGVSGCYEVKGENTQNGSQTARPSTNQNP